MTLGKLKVILKNVPDDAELLSNSGWECNETDMDGVWYNAELNEVHFTQGPAVNYSVYRDRLYYFEMLYPAEEDAIE